MISHFLTKQFVLFLLTGGTAALVNFGARVYFNQWLSYSCAIFFAYLTGMATAFLLARIFVFKAVKQSIGRSIFFFFLVNLVAVVQTWLVSMSMFLYVLPTLGFVEYSKEIAHAFGVLMPVFTSYLGHKYFSFK